MDERKKQKQAVIINKRRVPEWNKAGDILKLFPAPKKKERETLRTISLNALRLVNIPKGANLGKQTIVRPVKVIVCKEEQWQKDNAEAEKLNLSRKHKIKRRKLYQRNGFREPLVGAQYIGMTSYGTIVRHAHRGRYGL